MQFRLRQPSGGAVAIASLALAFTLVAGTAAASLTLSSSSISGDGTITLNPTGQPVTVNGALTGTCTGCGGSGGGSLSTLPIVFGTDTSLSNEAQISALIPVDADIDGRNYAMSVKAQGTTGTNYVYGAKLAASTVSASGQVFGD